MLLGILSTFLSSLKTVIDKKSLAVPNVLSPYLFTFLTWLSSLIIIVYLISIGKTEFTQVHVGFYILSLIICFLWIVQSNIGQYVYKNEKVSVIMPYTNLNKVVTIILSFFIFGDVSGASVFIALFIVVLITAASINIKKLVISKTIGLFLISELIVSCNMLLIGYVLLHVSSISYFIIINLISIAVLFLVLVYNKDIFKLKQNPAAYYGYRLVAGSISNLGYIMSLFIVATQGLVVSILFSFTYLFFIIVLGYFYLGDRPATKDILLSLSIIILVTIGIFLK